MAGRRWRLARRLSLLLLPRVVLAAAASASLSLVVLLLPPGGASASPFSPCVAAGASARQRSGVRVAAWRCPAARAACWEGCGHVHGSGGELVG